LIRLTDSVFGSGDSPVIGIDTQTNQRWWPRPPAAYSTSRRSRKWILLRKL
jgi:hypothetical protein